MVEAGGPHRPGLREGRRHDDHFHPEASRHVHRTIQLIKSHGCQAGLVLNPATPIEVLDYVLEELDMVL
jgi:pentose-5-phosphate-3-epimerase